jgi:hypothetical protein
MSTKKFHLDFFFPYLVPHCPGIGLSIVVCVVCIVSYCMLWIFPAEKIRRLRSGANPRSWVTWVPEASMQTPRPPKPLIEPATFRFVAQCLNQLRHRVLHTEMRYIWLKDSTAKPQSSQSTEHKPGNISFHPQNSITSLPQDFSINC